MRSVLGLDELRRNADAVSGAPHAAFKDRADAERFGDLADVLLLAFESEGGRARNYFQSRNLGEQVQDFFGQSVAEVFVLLVRAHVGKGQDGDGGSLGGGGCRWYLFERRANFVHGLEPAGGRLAQAARDDRGEV